MKLQKQNISPALLAVLLVWLATVVPSDVIASRTVTTLMTFVVVVMYPNALKCTK